MAVRGGPADQRTVGCVLVQCRESASVVVSVTSTGFKVTLSGVFTHVASILFAVAMDGRRSWDEGFEVIWSVGFRSSHLRGIGVMDVVLAVGE